MTESRRSGLSIALISVHGLVRGRDIELGRDADTGGQVKYVVELARALARAKEIASVDLLTRLIRDPRISDSYAEPVEELAPGARIVRLPFGPRRYLRKETLWPHLDSFLDSAIQHYRRAGRPPDVVHGHYADGGFVGVQLAQLLGVPFVFTGHSLGRVKKDRLHAGGVSEEAIERQYNISQRIEAEEVALENAAFVVASTRQEIEEQYSRYENYRPRRMSVMAPGIDLDRFRPPRRGDPLPPIAAQVNRFFQDPDKPLILAISRADPRKNVSTLVEAYAGSEALREKANLALVLGMRRDIRDMEKGSRRVFIDLLGTIDRHDLYGRIAYPKRHEPEDVPDLYRLAARTRGVFINPALTEPFGLTLLEAAASGLPVVATRDGGPRDILRNCRNGILVDPLDPEAIADALRALLEHRGRWRRASRNGLHGVAEHYTWDGHVEKYVKKLRSVIGSLRHDVLGAAPRSHLPGIEKLLICDIDNTLIGDRASLEMLVHLLRKHRGRLGWGVATGRRLESTLRVLKEWDLPRPDVLITAVGSEIHYGPPLVPETSWSRQIEYRWHPEALRELLTRVPGLKLQPKTEQRRFKLSFFVDGRRFPGMPEVRRLLRKNDLQAKAIYSHEAYLDLLPIRASKGQAVRFLALRWDIPPEALLVAGDSGNDEEMLTGNTLGVVVGNYSPELEPLRGRHRIYFAERPYAGGILEGIEHYGFLSARGNPSPDLAAGIEPQGGRLAD